MKKKATISVGIPSLGLLQRSNLILEAIRSVISQEEVSVRCYLIMNGNRFDPDLRRHLERDLNLTLLHSKDPGLRFARKVFRENISSDFFCYLDDDDILLPGALHSRVVPMLENAEIDAVLTDGWVQSVDNTISPIENFMCFPEDIRLAALSAPIICADNHLFRTSSVDWSILNAGQSNLEWLLIGAQLVLARKVVRIDQKTFVYRQGSSEQMSQSISFMESYPVAWNKIMKMNLTKEMKKIAGPKLATAYSRLAMAKMEQGEILEAWRAYLSCISSRHGLRYLPMLRSLVSRMIVG